MLPTKSFSVLLALKLRWPRRVGAAPREAGAAASLLAPRRRTSRGRPRTAPRTSCPAPGHTAATPTWRARVCRAQRRAARKAQKLRGWGLRVARTPEREPRRGRGARRVCLADAPGVDGEGAGGQAHYDGHVARQVCERLPRVALPAVVGDSGADIGQAERRRGGQVVAHLRARRPRERGATAGAASRSMLDQETSVSPTRRAGGPRTSDGLGAAGAGAAGMATAITRTLRRAAGRRTAAFVTGADSEAAPLRSITAPPRGRATTPRGAATQRACACMLTTFIASEERRLSDMPPAGWSLPRIKQDFLCLRAHAAWQAVASAAAPMQRGRRRQRGRCSRC